MSGTELGIDLACILATSLQLPGGIFVWCDVTYPTHTSPKNLDVTENHFPTIIFESNERVYFMLRVKNLVKVLALSTVMFGAGATVATVALSYLPTVNATPTKVAVGLKQSKAEEVDEESGLKFRVQNCNRSGKTVYRRHP